jgi:hypothetical protein
MFIRVLLPIGGSVINLESFFRLFGICLDQKSDFVFHFQNGKSDRLSNEPSIFILYHTPVSDFDQIALMINAHKLE